MNTVFPNWIRKLGIKKTIFLSIFGLIVLTYIAVPLITLACGGNNNGGGGGGSNSNANSNNNNGNKNKNKVKVTSTPTKAAKPAVGKSSLIDAGVFLISTQKGTQSFSKSDIRSLQIVMPITQITKNPPALTASEYNILLQDTPLTKSTPVQVEVLLNQPAGQRILTKGQFITKEIGGQRVGAIIVTTQDQQKILADQFATTQNDPFAKSLTGHIGKLHLQVPSPSSQQNALAR